MDIKRMYDMIEKLSECAKSEFDKGIDNVDACEMGKVTDMMKDLAEAMYYRTLTKAMDEADEEEIMEMFDRYGDRRFYDEYRYKTSGRYAPKGRGTYVGRRGYEEPPYYRMTPDMYREHEPRYYRDMDRSDGRMYYTDTGDMNRSGNSESSYDRAKRMYTETKNTHRDNSTESKQAKMRDLEQYMKELAEDVTQLLTDMTSEEKALIRNRMQVLMQKIQ